MSNKDAGTTDTKKFLSWGAVSFIETPSPRILSMAVLSLVLAFASCFTLSFFLKINVSVKTTGQIDSLLGEKAAVSQIAGELSNLSLKEGDFVQQGQVIGWLKMSGTHEAQVRSLITETQQKLSRIERKTTLESDGRGNHEFILESHLNARFAEADEKVQAFYHILNAGQNGTLKELRPLQSRLRFLNGQLQYLHSSPVKRYLRMQQYAIEEEKGHIQNHLAEIQNGLSSRIFTAQMEAEKALGAAISEASQFITNYQIRAPLSGRIAKLQVSAGTFVREAQEIVTIIPDNSPLIALVFVPTGEISKVKKGNTVSIKIDAYPPYKFGYFTGEVLSVENIKTSPTTREGGYLARISIQTDHPGREPAFAPNEVVRLLPGMVVEARVISKRASLMSLLIDKILGKDE